MSQRDAATGRWVGHVPRRAYGRPLSPRQAEVAALLSEGYRGSEIARIMGLSLKTVENHILWVRLKLGARSHIHAAVLYDRLVRR